MGKGATMGIITCRIGPSKYIVNVRRFEADVYKMPLVVSAFGELIPGSVFSHYLQLIRLVGEYGWKLFAWWFLSLTYLPRMIFDTNGILR